MAFFLLIDTASGWNLWKVASYIDADPPSHVCFHLKTTRKRSGKEIFMLTWSLRDGGLVKGSSEWRELEAGKPGLAKWCEDEIRRHMMEDGD